MKEEKSYTNLKILAGSEGQVSLRDEGCNREETEPYDYSSLVPG